MTSSDLQWVKYMVGSGVWSIASNCAESTIWKWGMQKYIPRRRHKMGVRPGPTTAELSKRRKYDERGEEIVRESNWMTRRQIMSKEGERLTGVVAKLRMKEVQTAPGGQHHQDCS